MAKLVTLIVHLSTIFLSFLYRENLLENKEKMITVYLCLAIDIKRKTLSDILNLFG